MRRALRRDDARLEGAIKEREILGDAGTHERRDVFLKGDAMEGGPASTRIALFLEAEIMNLMESLETGRRGNCRPAEHSQRGRAGRRHSFHLLAPPRDGLAWRVSLLTDSLTGSARSAVSAGAVDLF